MKREKHYVITSDVINKESTQKENKFISLKS